MDTSESTTKTCNKCGTEYPHTSEFFPTGSSGKLRAVCKQCVKAYKAQHYQEHHEEILAKQHAYYETHSEQIVARVMRWKAKYPELERERLRSWRLAHRDQEIERHRKYRIEHYEEARASERKYRKNHREQQNAASGIYRRAHSGKYRAHAHARRARKRGNGGSFTEADVALQYKTQKGLCWWCGDELNGKFHRDHRIAIDRGGSSNPENLVLACQPCNLSKGAKLPSEWSDRLL